MSFCLEELGMMINNIPCVFHHMGVPTTEVHPGERYSAKFGMYTSDSPCRMLRIQWHRFEHDSPLHPIIKTVPHVALRLDDLDRAVKGQNILLGPYEPIPNFRVAVVEDSGQPIELVQTTLTDEELWARAETDSLLYKV
jgi:hypothetical protein